MIEQDIKKLPPVPGIYLFKDEQGNIVYIGKAKNLKKRGLQYLQTKDVDSKVENIFAQSSNVEYMIADTELEALLLEAKLIQSHQPRCNVLLKSGQPFVYLFVSSAALPEFKIVRNQKQKGTYFGPFLEKSSARKVYDFLIKTFRLKLCKKKIANGCLFYHMGLCAGACRQDFNKDAYLTRLELAKNALKYGHKKFLEQLHEQIADHSSRLEYEKSRELHQYYQAFERVFGALDQKSSDIDDIARKDIWILSPSRRELFVFSERDNVLKKKRVFYFYMADAGLDSDGVREYFTSFYRVYTPPATILVNYDIGEDELLYEKFLPKFHTKEYEVSIIHPTQGHYAALVRLATMHAEQDLTRQATLARALKVLLKLDKEPRTIDCFDISHKQGRFMVGSCIRFKDGQPDKSYFRHFHIKTITQQDDYAALREIVDRRYSKHRDELPDLILIDGGKGQLNAVKDLFPDAEFASLAKREETIYSSRLPEGKILDQKTFAAQTLIALRDYAHHFAINFHRTQGKID